MRRTPPLLLGVVFVAASAAAQIELSYSIAGSGAVVMGYVGLPPAGDLIIPSSFENVPIVGIADYAFNDATGITNVSIPASVTNVGDGAFAGCTGLTAFTVDPQNPSYRATNGGLFDESLTKLVEFPGGFIGIYSIPTNVTDIGIGAFQQCKNLTGVVIPDSVKTIEDYAFENCSGLTNVTIPASVSNIGAGPFSGCESLTVIAVDANNLSFSGTNGALFNKNQSTLLEYPGGLAGNYTVPGSVTTLALTAFENCRSLSGITISSAVTNIGAGEFFGCANLTAITVSPQNPFFRGTNGVLFDKNQNTLLDFAPGLAGNYTAPATVTSIAADAFEDSEKLASVKLPGGLTNIGENAFYDCLSLTGVVIPGSVKNIGSGAFENCSHITVLTIDNGVANLESNAFENCYSLSSVSIPGSVTNIGQAAFDYCLSLPGIKIPTGVKNIGNQAFEYCSGLTGVTIAATVTNIGDEAFAYCSGLESITIPGNVASIGPHTFYECAGLTQFTIPGSVTNIGAGAFEQCYDLANVTISNGVKSIGDNAFSGCTSLAQVAIPESVSNIGVAPFSGCASLLSITVAAKNALFSDVDGVLFDKSQTALIEFPGGVAGSYAVPGTVTRIGDFAFVNCAALTNVVIPRSVTNIGANAFENCAGLANITIPDGVTSIGEYAFNGTEITNFYFTGNAPAIDSTAFDSDNNPAIYYLPGRTGWASFSASTGVPTTLWNAVIQIADSDFGVLSNRFGFDVIGSSNLVVVVQTTSDLETPAWIPVETVTLTNGFFHFSEPQMTNVSRRFFGLGFP